jgi:hypothetical protein
MVLRWKGSGTFPNYLSAASGAAKNSRMIWRISGFVDFVECGIVTLLEKFQVFVQHCHRSIGVGPLLEFVVR